ncbi:hypothetical protein [Psychrobacter sp. LV10R520-6]|uniref:hypothetical protein n=1 Tax=Psychrobacter sp. LV10R520-6 TaxID=1415574 RepID=UPI0024CD3FA4|nr:hypothetical protein [Psychrobacter sp. LV10R520-6]SNT70843.1 hypothetical protein SAMN04488491_2035 [Psychrobacter sp. LV10R520-6]
MEETMSSYSFSHQFYQRWTRAPEPLRAAIIQELTDITSLLQTDTPFEEFVFSSPDLDAHLNDLYENHNAEQAVAKAIAEKQTQQRAAAEQQRLEEEQKKNTEEKAKEKAKEAKLSQEAETAQKQQDKVAALEADKITDTNINTDTNTDKTSIDNESADDKANVANDSSIKTITDKLSQSPAIDLSLKDLKLSDTHKDLIHELEMHVDDYLSEQMAQMSENLKSWLRAELTQQLTQQEQSVDMNNKK